MPRPIEAVIHPDALSHNLGRARALSGDARIWAVVKANAYGHGIENCFEAQRLVADGFACLDLAEAERLRGLGWRGPILLLEGVFEPRDLELCSRLHLWHVIHHEAQIEWLAAHKVLWPQRVFLKLNSGMNRLGFRPLAFRAAWQRLAALPQVEDVSLMTHFSDADALRFGRDGVAHQLAVFEAACADLPGERSLANSAATLRHAGRPLGGGLNVGADWVRAGVMGYGGVPDYPEHDATHWDLRPAMSLRSQVLAVQELHPGDSVGYGSAFVAEAPMRVGIVACGYADGYPRHAPTGTPVLVAGQRSRTLGRVSMDLLTVDLTGLPQAGVGTEVTLWGCSAVTGAVLGIDEVAHAADTIGYELMCALAARVPVRVDGR
ncbi:alanine racemase [Inhella gelatinilytica]|uniref:Alanine racemase n=1 Tax=Inhella gelatinilytica TaxID=2795030 RepID=A0A931NEI7_9BURK|nr:alanine racemase [Inhella gelatinilytica]MBH9553729.1 alanine racemase [Inhella gelatinilytica]